MIKENKTNIEDLKKIIIKNLEDSKAEDIAILDLSLKSNSCQYMIVVSGTSNRHTQSIAEKLIYHLKHNEEDIYYKTEGLSEGSWVLVDIQDIVVHIFSPETRQFYDIEGLWGDSKTIKEEKNKP